MFPAPFLLLSILGLTLALPPPTVNLSPSLLPLHSASKRECTSWANWTAAHTEHDCFRALDIFYEHQVKPRLDSQGRLYEFVTRGQRPVGRDAPVWLPAAVVYRSCTLALVLLKDVDGRPLPEEDTDTKYERTDTTSFWNIYVLARSLLGGCVSTFEQVGWGAVGEDASIGVFVWGTGSLMQKKNFPKTNKVENNGTITLLGDGSEPVASK